MGIYKRKQESKKTKSRPRKRSRKNENKKENKNSTKKAIKKTRKQERKQELDQEIDKEKKKNFSLFLDHFLGRVLVILFSFINSHLRPFCHHSVWVLSPVCSWSGRVWSWGPRQLCWAPPASTSRSGCYRTGLKILLMVVETLAKGYFKKILALASIKIL